MTLDALFRPYRLTPRLTLPNRIVLAPCTRNRATADLSPTPGAARHYGERADAGLLITEAVLILPGIQGFIDTPGIFLDSHQRAWAGVADAVHDRGGRIFVCSDTDFCRERREAGHCGEAWGGEAEASEAGASDAGGGDAAGGEAGE